MGDGRWMVSCDTTAAATAATGGERRVSSVEVSMASAGRAVSEAGATTGLLRLRAVGRRADLPDGLRVARRALRADDEERLTDLVRRAEDFERRRCLFR